MSEPRQDARPAKASGQKQCASTVNMAVTEVRSLLAAPGTYFGRPSLRILADGTWVMVYIRAKHHWLNPDGWIEVMFSADEGRTWSAPNTCLDGTPVKGLPGRPSAPGSPYDPVEPYVYLAPSGELVATCMNVDLSGLSTGKQCHADGCAWIAVSGDNGRTWDAWRKVTFTDLPPTQSADLIDLTQESITDGGTIYASGRMGRRDGDQNKAIAGLFRSADNGRTWQFVNHIDPDVNWDRTQDCETGIERVGATEIAAVTRGTLQGCARPWLTRSADMGKTWTKLVQAAEHVRSWKRPRIYTRDHLRHLSGAASIPSWWNDNLVIGTGVDQVSADPFRRNVGLWYSADKGKTWSAPFHLDVDTEDAGYGDLRMRKNGELVVVSYHGSFAVAAVKQYVVRMEMAETHE